MKRSDFVRMMQQRLTQRRQELRRYLAGEVNELRDSVQSGVGDEIDVSVDSEHAAMRSQLADFESRELKQIDAALERVEIGRYGKCDTCDSSIGTERLRAVPYVADCIECARKAERVSNRSRGSAWDRYGMPTDEESRPKANYMSEM
ncbi:RNA polymerase-binding transcription factor DksA [Anatilimnocola aggregata]|uniref:RNA polymerase-binding transcription factor DksA n=1 Tax=Anatilimnocola aggregata TaxID=2528021 RepID=A0A517Y4M7_9BACT|nr:TraR/DksA C4-type zinc finger protein [Anatilimnocola aggregata]QDU25185.1 RNA polymerase-binding transcription factor DksA [Anatilimnocola aggregata]